eukprot:1946941-Prymnesium_polylepis.1
MRWRWKLRSVRARRPPAEPAWRLPCGVHPCHLPQGSGRRAVEAAVRLVDDGPHLHLPLQRAVVVGLLDGHVAGAVSTCRRHRRDD